MPSPRVDDEDHDLALTDHHVDEDEPRARPAEPTIVELPEEAEAPAGTSGLPAASPATGKGQKRRPRPTIDIDASINECKNALKQAQKKVQAAKMEARNEKRRKQRVVKKAASLSLEDLERIAVLKRCGLITEQTLSQATAPKVAANVGGPASSSSGSAPSSAPSPA